MATPTATAMTTLAAQIKDLKYSIRPLDRLIRFIAKYPPSQYSALATGQAVPTAKQRVIMSSKPISSKNLPQASLLPTSTTQDSYPVDNSAVEVETESFDDAEQTFSSAVRSAAAAESTLSSPQPQQQQQRRNKSFPPNPFLPTKQYSRGGRWRGARVGLRVQADLYRHARELGVELLLPPSVKSSAYKQQRALERGLAVKGTGAGEQVKGHKWERQMAGTLEKRRKAMEGMPELIREWEQRGHGRGWKKYPR